MAHRLRVRTALACLTLASASLCFAAGWVDLSLPQKMTGGGDVPGPIAGDIAGQFYLWDKGVIYLYALDPGSSPATCTLVSQFQPLYREGQPATARPEQMVSDKRGCVWISTKYMELLKYAAGGDGQPLVQIKRTGHYFDIGFGGILYVEFGGSIELCDSDGQQGNTLRSQYAVDIRTGQGLLRGPAAAPGGGVYVAYMGMRVLHLGNDGKLLGKLEVPKGYVVAQIVTGGNSVYGLFYQTSVPGTPEGPLNLYQLGRNLRVGPFLGSIGRRSGQMLSCDEGGNLYCLQPARGGAWQLSVLPAGGTGG